MKKIGVIGLGVMGESLALNMANKNISVAVYNRTKEKTDNLVNVRDTSNNISGYYDLKNFVDSLEKPRKIILMAKAGNPVDELIEQLIDLVEEDDIIIDGGNSYFKDTQRRYEYLKNHNINFLGLGISGGEEGALLGPSMMPGGDFEVYRQLADILDVVSAKSKYGSCSKYMGNHGAGHFVKMVHNGIEYALMQAIAEVYDLLRNLYGLSNVEISKIFESYNNGKLNSYLMEISAIVLKKEDEITNKGLVDVVLDKAGQKGTGNWTVKSGIDLGIPIPSINQSVVARTISHFKDLRVKINKLGVNFEFKKERINDEVIKELENALYFVNIITYSQGLWLIEESSREYGFNINIKNVLENWTDGCIIRAELLDFYLEVISDNQNIMENQKVIQALHTSVIDTKKTVNKLINNNIPSYVISSSLNYYFGMKQINSAANLIQAQRDLFGAHTYERIDMEGIFHSNWQE